MIKEYPLDWHINRLGLQEVNKFLINNGSRVASIDEIMNAAQLVTLLDGALTFMMLTTIVRRDDFSSLKPRAYTREGVPIRIVPGDYRFIASEVSKYRIEPITHGVILAEHISWSQASGSIHGEQVYANHGEVYVPSQELLASLPTKVFDLGQRAMDDRENV